MSENNTSLPAAAVSRQPCECWFIPASDGLDAIHVFFIDRESGVGYVTIICYGQAWTAFFGAMSGKTIAEFVVSCDVGYLVTKMGIGPHLKTTKRDNIYIGRIIKAVQNSLAQVGRLPNAAGK